MLGSCMHSFMNVHFFMLRCWVERLLTQTYRQTQGQVPGTPYLLTMKRYEVVCPGCPQESTPWSCRHCVPLTGTCSRAEGYGQRGRAAAGIAAAGTERHQSQRARAIARHAGCCSLLSALWWHNTIAYAMVMMAQDQDDGN